MTDPLVTRAPADMRRKRRDPVDAKTLRQARAIVDDVRERGEEALREHAVRLGDLAPGGPLVLGHQKLVQALDAIDHGQRELLERTADRIHRFAMAQKDSLTAVEVSIPGGTAGQDIAPVARAGCYAPGGRFPLPSSVLMTAVTARTAGVAEVWVASPRPTALTMAAAAVAGADRLLAVGGAQAIAALAFGAGPVPACDVVVGPGNRFVTAAKQLVSGHVAIDMLAGPSELVVLADESASAGTVAADLLAQAEHDPDAVPVLVTTSADLVARVNNELVVQLADLPTAGTAGKALENGCAVLAGSLDEAVDVTNMLAPEHLELHVKDVGRVLSRLAHYGGLFVGSGAAVVLGDYGAGPNHTLPTSGTARYTGGLSVLDFLRVRTWMRIDDPAAAADLVEDAARLGELEGLVAHARAVRRRLC